MTASDTPPPLTDEEVEQYRELIDMHRQYGPALSIEGEARLLAEVDRLRAENTDMRRKVAFAAAIVSGDAAEMLPETIKQLRAERDAQAAKLAAVRAIEPRQRTGLTTPTLLAEVSGWNGAVATVRAALGETGGTDE